MHYPEEVHRVRGTIARSWNAQQPILLCERSQPPVQADALSSGQSVRNSEVIAWLLVAVIGLGRF